MKPTHQPISKRWIIAGVTPQGVAWIRRTNMGRGYYAISSRIVVKEPHHETPNEQFLVSFSFQNGKGPQRISNVNLAPILREWGIDDQWEEDNHERGAARKFWLPLEERYRRPCPCKDEVVITEGDYSYSVKKPIIGERTPR